MDPVVWATIAEFWWIGPAVIGTGTVGWLGVRHDRRARARRVAYDAARLDVRAAKQELASARTAVKVARADLARVQAERAASRASGADVADARVRYQQAQREAKAAWAGLRAARARVTATRAALPSPATPAADLPLARLIAQHDAVTARWMSYETDAAKTIAFPALSDGRHPPTAAFLTLQAEALHLRPKADRVTAAEFAAYRAAVSRVERAFDTAEADAWRIARASGTASADQFSATSTPSASVPPAHWTVVAQSMIARSAESLTRATEAAAAAFESAREAAGMAGRATPRSGAPGDAAPPRPERPRTTPPRTEPPSTEPPQPAAGRDTDDPPAAAPEAPRRGDGPPPVWPVPRRG